MPYPSVILKMLPEYNNNYVVLSSFQDVPDIIAGMKVYHEKSAADYDKIYSFFIGKDELQTCRNIYSFMRSYIPYVPEPLDEQKVKTPAAILAERNYGTDCKNFSLFACGVLDAVNRSGLQHIPYAYRYCSYNIMDSTPTHVFCVCWPNTSDEIFIDGVLPTFNEQSDYFTYTDKKFKAMSLYGVSGVTAQSYAKSKRHDPVEGMLSALTVPGYGRVGAAPTATQTAGGLVTTAGGAVATVVPVAGAALIIVGSLLKIFGGFSGHSDWYNFKDGLSDYFKAQYQQSWYDYARTNPSDFVNKQKQAVKELRSGIKGMIARKDTPGDEYWLYYLPFVSGAMYCGTLKFADADNDLLAYTMALGSQGSLITSYTPGLKWNGTGLPDVVPPSLQNFDPLTLKTVFSSPSYPAVVSVNGNNPLTAYSHVVVPDGSQTDGSFLNSLISGSNSYAVSSQKATTDNSGQTGGIINTITPGGAATTETGVTSTSTEPNYILWAAVAAAAYLLLKK